QRRPGLRHHVLVVEPGHGCRLGWVGGFAVLMFVFIRGFIFYGHAANDSSPPFLGLGVPDWIGMIGIVGGILLMLLRRRTSPGFFRREKRLVYGDPIKVTPEAEFAPADSLL
ncbi:MAG TPA: hypothetical protein VG325_07380, partial [Solirubrobacteraceae bacterium]|nr:hypothetical protein [Solirubrobacteraceae bacterium]